MSLSADVPLRLSRADVWRLMKDGFNANEIAYFAGVSVAVALGMMNEAAGWYWKPMPQLREAA